MRWVEYRTAAPMRCHSLRKERTARRRNLYSQGPTQMTQRLVAVMVEGAALEADWKVRRAYSVYLRALQYPSLC